MPREVSRGQQDWFKSGSAPMALHCNPICLGLKSCDSVGVLICVVDVPGADLCRFAAQPDQSQLVIYDYLGHKPGWYIRAFPG